MEKLLVLLKPTNRFYDKILTRIGNLQNISLVLSDSYSLFCYSVTRNLASQKVVLLCIENENDFKYLSNLRDLLSSSKIIFLLPDKRKEMIREALLFRPLLLLFTKDKDSINLLTKVLIDSFKEGNQ